MVAQDYERDTIKLGNANKNMQMLHEPMTFSIVTFVHVVKDTRTEGGQAELIAGDASAGGGVQGTSLGHGWAIC